MLVVDADNHYYEPYDAFTRHIEAAFADRSVHVEETDSGRRVVMIGQERLRAVGAHPQDFVGPPGSMRELFDHKHGDGFRHTKHMRAGDDPSFVDRAARLRFLDAQGIDAAILFPTLGVVVEHALHHDVEGTYANLRAFNRWLEEDWGFGADGRLFAAPLMSLLDVDQAVMELDRVLAAGARILHLRPSHLYGTSPADPSLDAFWARVQEANVPVALHTSWSAYHECVSTLWGEHADPRFNEIAPLQWYLGIGARPIMDTLAAMVLHNLFGRFPRLRVVSVEHGSTWVAHLLEALDHAFLLGRGGRHLGGELTDKPSAILKEHFYIAPYPEEDVESLVSLLGPEHVLFGSDYPHPEGLERPREYVDRVAPLGPEATKRIMGGNAWGLLDSKR